MMKERNVYIEYDGYTGAKKMNKPIRNKYFFRVKIKNGSEASGIISIDDNADLFKAVIDYTVECFECNRKDVFIKALNFI